MCPSKGESSRTSPIPRIRYSCRTFRYTPTLLLWKRGCCDRQNTMARFADSSMEKERMEKKGRKGLDKQGREKRLRERLNRPSLTVIIPRMDGEAEKFWRGVLLSSFLETRNEWLTLRWQAECRPNWNNKGTTNEEEEEEEERMPSKRWPPPFLSLSLESSRKVCLKGIRHHASRHPSSVPFPANCKAGRKIVLFKLVAEGNNTGRRARRCVL